MSRRGSVEDEPLLADPELHDLVARGAAPVLGNRDEAPDAEPDLLAAERHRVGDRADVAAVTLREMRSSSRVSSVVTRNKVVIAA
jgi:hypothetical protein